jgi:hypothetical protein
MSHHCWHGGRRDLQVTVSHRQRRLCSVARHCAGARWDDNGRLGMTRDNLAVDVDAVLIVSTVGGERGLERTRRSWRKQRIAVDADAGQISAAASRAMMEPSSPSVCRRAKPN